MKPIIIISIVILAIIAIVAVLIINYTSSKPAPTTTPPDCSKLPIGNKYVKSYKLDTTSNKCVINQCMPGHSGDTCDIPPVQNFAAIEYYTLQIWKSDVLTSNANDWTYVPGPDASPIDFIQILQLQDGSFACIEYESHQICTSQKLLTSDRNDWVFNDNGYGSSACQHDTSIYGQFYDIFYSVAHGWSGPCLNADVIQFNQILQLNDASFACLERSSNQIFTSKILSNNTKDWTYVGIGNVGTIGFRQILQLQDGTFAAIEYYTHQLRTSKTLSNDVNNWDATTVESPMPFVQILQLKDGTFAAIEFYSNQVWLSNTLSYKYSDWKSAAGTVPLGFKNILQLK